MVWVNADDDQFIPNSVTNTAANPQMHAKKDAWQCLHSPHPLSLTRSVPAILTGKQNGGKGITEGENPAYNPKDLKVGQHAVLEAAIQEVIVLPQDLIDGRHLPQLALHHTPVRLQDLDSHVVLNVLHEAQHTLAQ